MSGPRRFCAPSVGGSTTPLPPPFVLFEPEPQNGQLAKERMSDSLAASRRCYRRTVIRVDTFRALLEHDHKLAT